MLTQEPRRRILPLLVSLIVIGVLLMTFDVRSQGGGLVGALRTGTQSLVAPLQKAASYVVNPVADLVDSLSNITNLRQENAALRSELLEAEAALVAVQDKLALLEYFEQLYEMESAGSDIGRTVANVIGRAPFGDASFTIDKGTSDGIARNQPVIDTNGFVVGTVQSVTRTSATIVPITAARQGLSVIVGDQVGMLQSQAGTNNMRLEITDARAPVLAGERVSTAAISARFPSGLPVGVVINDAAPLFDNIDTTVEPFVNPETLRIVVVLAWPPDPASITEDDVIIPAEDDPVTTTTIPASTTTSGEGG